jgi:recombination protein RecT
MNNTTQPVVAAEKLEFRKKVESCIHSGMNLEKFFTLAAEEYRKSSNLAACTKQSINQGLLEAATLGVYVGTDEAYLVAYKVKDKPYKEAQLVLGYRGILKILYRAGLKTIHIGMIYENDDFSYGVVNNQVRLDHKPVWNGDKGRPTGVYAIATLENDYKYIEVMNQQDLEMVKESSHSPKKEFLWRNFEEEMAKKSVIRRLIKRIPVENYSPEIIDILEQTKKEEITFEKRAMQEVEETPETPKSEVQESIEKKVYKSPAPPSLYPPVMQTDMEELRKQDRAGAVGRILKKSEEKEEAIEKKEGLSSPQPDLDTLMEEAYQSFISEQ